MKAVEEWGFRYRRGMTPKLVARRRQNGQCPYTPKTVSVRARGTLLQSAVVLRDSRCIQHGGQKLDPFDFTYTCSGESLPPALARWDHSSERAKSSRHCTARNGQTAVMNATGQRRSLICTCRQESVVLLEAHHVGSALMPRIPPLRRCGWRPCCEMLIAESHVRSRTWNHRTA